MESIKIIFTKLALNDLIEITNYYEQKQQGLSSRFVKNIQKHLEILPMNPQIGRPGKVFGTRELVISNFPYIVVYRVRKTQLQIITILHQSKQYPK